MKTRKTALKTALLLFALLVFSVPAFGDAITSGRLTADKLVFTGKCAITAVVLKTDATNDASLIIYDNTEGSGKIVADYKVTSSDNQDGRVWVSPGYMENGIYADVTTDGTAYFYIEYERR